MPNDWASHYNQGRWLVERGEFENGEVQLRKALEIAAERHPGTRWHAFSLCQLGGLLLVGSYDASQDEVEALLEGALHVWRAIPDASEFASVGILGRLAMLADDRNDRALSERYDREVVEVLERTVPSDHPFRANRNKLLRAETLYRLDELEALSRR